MRKKQILIHENQKEDIHNIFEMLLEKCYIDPLTGKFYCKKCNTVVHIDLSKQIVYCPIHGLLI